MNEYLLQYLWRHQYFDKKELQTTRGERIQILHPGTWNRDQGPDFSNARIRIEDQLWAGQVEIHCQSRDWNRHGHGPDPQYRNVILHVVWEENLQVNEIPVLELSGRVPRHLLDRYSKLLQNGQFIPCEKNFPATAGLTETKWLERLLIERMERKAIPIKTQLEQSQYHWEETTWWLLAGNFGGKINGQAFQSIARQTPLRLLTRHLHQPHQIESLLLGQAGLLDPLFQEVYPQLLRNEYRFLRKKYGLVPIHEPIRFARMRPGNFPTIRLAQLAALITRTPHFFSRLLEADSIATVQEWLSLTASPYWHHHYRLEEPSVACPKNLGPTMIQNILINTVCPLLYVYGQHKKEWKWQEKAVDWLEQLPAEQHRISRGFALLGKPARHAADAQALTELHNEYCNQLRCLECRFGHDILGIHQDQAPQFTRTMISG